MPWHTDLAAENLINWRSNKGIRPTHEVHWQDNISQLTHFLKTQGKNLFYLFFLLASFMV